MWTFFYPYLKTWEGRVSDDAEDTQAQFAINWMEQRLAEVSNQMEDLFKDFRLSEGLKTLYSLIWNDFCSWYLEWVKPAMDQPIQKEVYERTIGLYERLLQLLHPYMPFITEEIYHALREGRTDDLINRQLAPVAQPDVATLKDGALLQELITAIRDTRNKNQLKPKETIKLYIDTQDQSFYNKVKSILARQVNAEEISFTQEAKQGSISIVVQTDKLYIVADAANVDTGAQKEQMLKEIDYLKGFLASVEKKLGNERFVQNAKPEIIENERKKQADALAKIKALEESISLL